MNSLRSIAFALALSTLPLASGCAWGYVNHVTRTDVYNPVDTICIANGRNISGIDEEQIFFGAWVFGNHVGARRLFFRDMTVLEIRTRGSKYVVFVYGPGDRILAKFRVADEAQARRLADALATLHARAPVQ